MRVVIAGDYPESPPNVVGGIQAVIYNTLQYLGTYEQLDLHIVTCEKWRNRPLTKPEVVREGSWTVHYLPSSARVPHSLSMLTTDRWAVRRRIEALAPDLIHAHGQAAAYPYAAFDTGRPTAVTVHGINAMEAQVDPRGGPIKGRLRVALWGYAERGCLRRASDVVVISPFVHRVIGPYTSARLHTIENPVHDAFFHLDPEPELGRVLMVGSVKKCKGTLEAIRAFSLVRREVRHARLFIAGGFAPAYREYGAQVRRYVSEIGAEDYVHFFDHLGHDALLEAYRTSQVFIMPSYLESSPVALAQAMAAALPSVVSDIGGTEHMIEDGLSGYRVPVADPHALADRIVCLLQDEIGCRQKGRVAREFARAHHSAQVAARKTHRLYHTLAGTR